MADEFPSAKVIGTDLAPTQPNWVPPNLEFQIDDCQLDWTFEPESFDFIHIRYLQGSIEDWNKLYGQIFKFLKPGGWFQHIEPDLQMLSDNPEIVVDDDQYVPRVFIEATQPPLMRRRDELTIYLVSSPGGLNPSARWVRRLAEHSTSAIRRWKRLQRTLVSLPSPSITTRFLLAAGPGIERSRSWGLLSASLLARHWTALSSCL